VKHQPVKQGQTTAPGISSPTLSEECVGSLTSPANHITLKMPEMGPTVHSPYPRRPERLTIYKCHYIQRQHVLLSYIKTLSVGPAEVRTCDLPHSSTN